MIALYADYHAKFMSSTPYLQNTPPNHGEGGGGGGGGGGQSPPGLLATGYNVVLV